jgi:hypothetical protein
LNANELRELFPNAGPAFITLNSGGKLPDAKPQRHKTPALGATAQGAVQGIPRLTVRFTGHRVRPLDPDNFAGSCKDLLDGLRHAGLIPGDEPWRIKLETEQVKESHFKDEKTIIEIIP